MIEERKGPGTLNRKLEYNRCLFPSLGIENTRLGKNLSVEERARITDPDQRWEYEEAEKTEEDKEPENRKRTTTATAA